MTTRTTIRARRTKTKKSKPQALAWLLCAFALGAVLNLPAGATPAWASGPAATTTKVPKLRTIEGLVCSKEGTPLQGAVVYLQDSKSLTVKSYLSDAQGRFHFRQLSMSADFDLWAELNGKRSKTRTISQFNSKTDLNFKLTLPVSK
ncbi:MAG TPA: carboxypeptidase-like regulatory domain-containing protein [Acidobacteriaceae bacterium]|nr:carboxypeptidase-like regulatory domain-containing protein [Acidobacteriaceae bacterium]